MKKFALLASAAVAVTLAKPASAAVIIVKAFDHSSNSGSGTGLNTGIGLTFGQTLTITSSTNDLWSAGALPRYSDATGLIGNRFATAADDSGQLVGTQIGKNWGILTIGGFSAPYGALVGKINGVYQYLGANFSCPAWQTGNLTLFYWDSYTPDNFGEIAFNVNTIPESATWLMMLAGFGAVGFALRRRRQHMRVSFA